MNTLDEILRVLGVIVQALGALAFGVAGGWFTLKAFKSLEGDWRLRGIVYGVFFAFVAWLSRFTSPGAMGAFLLGVSGAFIYWGMIGKKKSDEGESE